MPKSKFGAINLSIIIVFLVVIIFSIMLGKNIAQQSLRSSVFFVAGIIIAVATFLRTDLGIFAIIFSMLLSPEISVGAVPGRDIILRAEDILLIIVALTWFIKTSVLKEIPLIKSNPLNKAIAAYICVVFILTLRGMLIGAVLPTKGCLYLLKYFEYFILYYMIINHVETKKQARTYLIAFLITCAITCLYANMHIGAVARLSAPFEGTGEPNTLGGYLVFMMAIVVALWQYSESERNRFWLGALALFILPAFLFTLSRTSYLAMLPMWLALIAFGPKKNVLAIVLVLGLIASFIYLPERVQRRLEITFERQYSPEVELVRIGDVTLDPSSSIRIRSWQNIIQEWKKRPLLGYGITGVGFIDGQYVRLLGEIGILGLMVFLFLLIRIFKSARAIFIQTQDRFFKGLSLGFLAGFIGLIFFNIGANGFILIRIMEPFWFIAGIVMMTPQILSRKEEENGQFA